ncbi:hypothetical protein ACS0TY_035897 [Phlomoides rotata]
MDKRKTVGSCISISNLLKGRQARGRPLSLLAVENKKRNTSKKESKPSNSIDSASGGYRFPLKQAVTSASLCLTGDTVAQLRHRWVRNKDTLSHSDDFKDVLSILFSEHDYIRALRMSSYGFLLYGPGSYAWYQFLDHIMHKQNVQNLMMKGQGGEATDAGLMVEILCQCVAHSTEETW